jgi:hypothetical protein
MQAAGSDGYFWGFIENSIRKESISFDQIHSLSYFPTLVALFSAFS